MEGCSIPGEKLTVAFMDIDQLKAVKDGFGHCVGDNRLKEVASIIKKNIRKGISRYNGNGNLVFPMS